MVCKALGLMEFGPREATKGELQGELQIPGRIPLFLEIPQFP